MIDVRAVLVTAALAGVCGWAMGSSLLAAEPKAGPAECLTYVKPDGEAFFGVTLQAQVDQVSEEPRQIVVLFDTSASQVGVFREKALGVLTEFLKALRPQDQVRLFAIDIDAKPLTDKFFSPQEPAMDRAMEALKKRTPLGATDLPLALDHGVLAHSVTTSKSPRSILLIGDSMSPANLFDPESLPKFLEKAAAEKISINSFVLGPRFDVALAATIANHTGGVVAVDSADFDAKKLGQFLANATHAEVFWPTRTRLPDQIVESLPTTTPPLRTDRETVFVGRGKFERPFRIEISAATVDGPKADFVWNIVPTPSDDVNAYLVELVVRNRKTNGMLLPLAGAAALREAKSALAGDLQTVVALGQQALALNNPESAEQLARKALTIDPNSPDALAILGGARKKWIEAAQEAVKKKEFEQAAQLLLRALAIDPKDPEALKALESLPKVAQDRVRAATEGANEAPPVKEAPAIKEAPASEKPTAP